MTFTSGFMAIHRSYYNKPPFPAPEYFRYAVGRYRVLKSGECRGCDSEFLITIKPDSVQLWLIESWDDSWKLWSRPEFQTLMTKLANLAKRDAVPSDDQIFACLLKSGFRDLTQYVQREKI